MGSREPARPDLGFDFTGRRVLVTGGTRGPGLQVARAFGEAGASVLVTGTKIFPSLYDTDLSGLEYHQAQLARNDSIDRLVEAVGVVDVLINAAGARMPIGDAAEREFLEHSARLGLNGPERLTHRLRHVLTRPDAGAGNGGAVIHLGATLRWLALTYPPDQAVPELARRTQRAGSSWRRSGARVNAVLGGDGPARPTDRRAASATRTLSAGSTAMFLASSGARGVNGQLLRLGDD